MHKETYTRCLGGEEQNKVKYKKVFSYDLKVPYKQADNVGRASDFVISETMDVVDLSQCVCNLLYRE